MGVYKVVVFQFCITLKINICIPFDILRLCQMCKITFHLNRTMESFIADIKPRMKTDLLYMYLYKQVPSAFWQVIPCKYLTELPRFIVPRVIPFMSGDRQTIETEIETGDPSVVDNGMWFKDWNLWRSLIYLHLKFWVSWSKDKVYKNRKRASNFV